ncbi:MAG: ABC transporter permease [Christensenellales bacterium]
MRGILFRNLKVFFRDKTSVFFSLLSVFIIIGLYALFLGNVWASSMSDIKNPRILMDSWIMAGLLSVTSVTTTMGVFGIMVDDRAKKISKDFYSAPISRRSIVSGYVASAFCVSVILSLVALVLGQLYILSNGGALLNLLALIKIIGMVLLTSLCSTSMMYFLVSFLRSQNAFATASTIIGTIIGFITGIYLPIGQLPEAVQTIIKIFPISHSALLFRQILMEAPMASSFAGVPAEFTAHFKETMGMEYKIGGSYITPLVSILILIGTALLFYGLAIWHISKKSKQ